MGLTANGIFVLSLSLFALHVLNQPLVYNIFSIIGGVLVVWGCARIYVEHKNR